MVTKICIYGAGAIGGYLAAGIAGHRDVELSVVARGPHLAAIKQNGLLLEMGDERRLITLRATSDPAELGPQDYVVVALKAHQAWQAAPQMRPLLDHRTHVLTCQNGVPWWYFHKLPGQLCDRRINSVDPEDRQWQIVGPERAIGCVVYPATEIVAPGVIHHHYGDKFPLGEPDGTTSDRCLRLSEILQDSGFRAPVVDDIRSEIWLKLWGNLCFNPISALTRATLDVVATDPDTRDLARAMMLEAEVVANKLGATLRVDVDRRIDGAAKVGPHRTSMLQDLESGRVMEIDALVCAVQELGRVVGVPTPCIDIVLGLVRQLGRSLGIYPALPEQTAVASEGATAA